MPKGTLENYALQVSAKVEKYEEEKKQQFGGLTKDEFEEANLIMDPN